MKLEKWKNNALENENIANKNFDSENDLIHYSQTDIHVQNLKEIHNFVLSAHTKFHESRSNSFELEYSLTNIYNLKNVDWINWTKNAFS